MEPPPFGIDKMGAGDFHLNILATNKINGADDIAHTIMAFTNETETDRRSQQGE